MSFKDLRKKANMTISESSKLLGIKEKTLYKYESSIRHPSTAKLILMAKIYNCTYEEIMNAYRDNIRKSVNKYGKRNP